jgi:dipeptidyl aminopeptidase/acylaminoacyl peptidase
MPVDRSAPTEQLTQADGWVMPYDASPDGKTLLVQEQTPATTLDISVLALGGERTLGPYLHTEASEAEARFSPDGRFVAYESDDSGRSEVYVMPFPGPGGRSQVSAEGGFAPTWSRDGRELFYRNTNAVWAVSVETRPGFRATPPRKLFDFEQPGPSGYDVAPDGQSFFMVRSPLGRVPRSPPRGGPGLARRPEAAGARRLRARSTPPASGSRPGMETWPTG